MAAFSITSAQPAAKLPLDRKGRVDFTVTNTSRRDLTARAHVVPEGGAHEGWFTVVGPQRDSPPDATHQFGVRVAVPITAPAGSYRFRLDVVGVEDPDEFEGEGVWATLEVPAAPEPRRVPLWAIAVAAVVLIAVVLVVYFRFIRQPAAPSFDVSASTQSFPSIPVGQGSQGSVVTIKNTGGSAAKVSATLVGSGASDFKVLATTCADTPLQPGATCQLQVGFQPSVQGTRAATLTVKAPNARTPVLLTMTGTGQGTQAAVGFTPPTVVLTASNKGPNSNDPPPPVATVITVKNNGGTPVHITSVKLLDPSSAFQLVSACDGRTLDGTQSLTGAGSCQIVVIFTKGTSPSLVPGQGTVTAYNAQMVVVDDAPGGQQTVPISGNRR